MRRVAALLFVAAMLAAVPAAAQDEKPVSLNIGVGYTSALSDVKNYLGNGYNLNLGLTFNLNPVIGIQAEYSFNGLGQKQVNLPVSVNPLATASNQPFYGDMNMQYGDFNMILKPPVSGNARPYLVAGMGVYYRPMKVTTPSVGYVPGYCNPWYYVCVPGGYVPVDQIVGSRSSTDFGMDFGGGVNLLMGGGKAVYFEARYHYIWGPSVTNPTTSAAQKATGQFLPITVGVRF